MNYETLIGCVNNNQKQPIFYIYKFLYWIIDSAVFFLWVSLNIKSWTSVKKTCRLHFHDWLVLFSIFSTFFCNITANYFITDIDTIVVKSPLVQTVVEWRWSVWGLSGPKFSLSANYDVKFSPINFHFIIKKASSSRRTI